MYRGHIIILIFIFISELNISAQSFKKEQPNILFCISDDQSWTHTSFAGEMAISTPAFDRIASEGIYFNNAFCASPSCSPSRGAIITGQEIWRLGEAAQLFSAVPKVLEKVSFPLLLEDNGYYIGYTQKGWAPNDFTIHDWPHYPIGKRYSSQTLRPPTDRIVKNNYAANFEDFLKECPENQPFFFWFGSSEPHRAFEENSGAKHGIDLDEIIVPEFLPDVKEVRNDIADYLYEIKWVDQHFDKMIKMLDDRKLLDNTIIIFTSDNGMPFPAAKNNLYEYGIHMPLAIHWPNGIESSGRIINELVSLTDLAPTLLECAGIKIPEAMTGKSLLNVFNNSSDRAPENSRQYVFAGKERHTVCRENDLPYPQRSIRNHNFLFIRNLEPDRWPAGAPDIKSAHGWYYGDIDLSPSLTYIIDHRKDPGIKNLFDLAISKRPAEELFDIINDPFCLVNLISEPQYEEVSKTMSLILDNYLEETGDPRALTGNSIWDEFPYYHQNPNGIVPYDRVLDE